MTARAIPIVPSCLAGAGVVRDPDLICSDEELFHHLRRKNAAALEVLFLRYGDRLAGVAMGLTGNRHDVEDIMQEVLLRALDGAKRANDEAQLWPWLVGITCNTCREFRRRRRGLIARFQRWLLRTEPYTKPDVPSFESDYEQRELRNAVTALPAIYREVVVLRYFESMTLAETSHLLQLPEGTVKSRCHSALAILRTTLKESERHAD